MIRILSEIEIINIVDHELRTSKSIIDMNQVNKAFRNVLIEHRMSADEVADNYKKELPKK